MSSTLDGKIALVTGAGAGIGRAAAELFAAEGAKVVASDLDRESGEETVGRILKNGGTALFREADISDPDQVEELFDEIMSRYGRLDCAFNNAGIEGDKAPAGECGIDNFDKVLAVNLRGLWLCMKNEINRMIEQGGGAIVNMSSVAGLVGFPELPAYCASKHGVVGLTRAAALEYAEKNIRINAVCPGVIGTEMIERITGGDPETKEEFRGYEPVGRMGKPEEIAQAALWLCSDRSSFVTGEALAVDGGFAAG